MTRAEPGNAIDVDDREPPATQPRKPPGVKDREPIAAEIATMPRSRDAGRPQQPRQRVVPLPPVANQCAADIGEPVREIDVADRPVPPPARRGRNTTTRSMIAPAYPETPELYASDPLVDRPHEGRRAG
jgi:hypothetical protein